MDLIFDILSDVPCTCKNKSYLLTHLAQPIQTILIFVKIALSVTDLGVKVFLVPPSDPHDFSLQLIKRDHGEMVYHNVLSYGNR